jgi:hypothetical protein
MATIRETRNPKIRERITLEKPPMTVNKPFIPHAQAIAPWGFFPNPSIPRGNGIPRKNPKGKIIRKQTRIRMRVDDARNRLNIYLFPTMIRKAVRIIPINGIYHLFLLSLTIYFEEKLPMPAERSMLKITAEYV